MFDEKTMQRLVDLTPYSILLVDKEGVIRYINKQTSVRFGYDTKELVGQKVEVLIPGEKREKHVGLRDGYMKHPVERPMAEELNISGVTKDGTIFPCEIALNPIEVNGEPYISTIIRDTTEKKRRQKHLDEARADLEQFIFIASHNLQEPIKSLQQYIEILFDEGYNSLPQQSQDVIMRLKKSSEKMSKLIHSMLTFSRIGREKEIKTVNCYSILEDVKEDLHAYITENNAEIVVEGTLPTLPLYPSEFHYLLQNLIHNGIKFHKPNERPLITISAEPTQEKWKFCVEDNGIGIEEKFLPKMFLMFQRNHNQRDFPGTGIGLTHCKKIVHLHGGEIWAESKLGVGTRFFFTIPFNITVAKSE